MEGQPDKAEAVVHVEPSGLRVVTTPLEWPPKDREAERTVIFRYLDGHYDRLQKADDARKGQLERELEADKKAQRDGRSSRLRMSVVTFGLAMLLLASALFGRAQTEGWGVVLLILSGVIFGSRYAMTGGTVASLRVDQLPTHSELDEIYDRVFQADLSVFWAGATRMLAVEKAGRQENYVGPFLNFPSIEETSDCFWGAHRGSDGRTRFTPRSMYYLSFHADQLITYEGAMDIVRGVPVYHKLREFSYQDITSVTRTTKTKSFKRIVPERDSPTDATSKADDNNLITTQEIVLLNLLNGESISIVLNDSYLSSAENESAAPQSQSDQVVELIRSLVRDKKRHALNVPGRGPGSTPGSAAFSG